MGQPLGFAENRYMAITSANTVLFVGYFYSSGAKKTRKPPYSSKRLAYMMVSQILF